MSAVLCMPLDKIGRTFQCALINLKDERAFISPSKKYVLFEKETKTLDARFIQVDPITREVSDYVLTPKDAYEPEWYMLPPGFNKSHV